VKGDDPDVITFLLNTEIIPLSLRIMERGSDLSKTVATFIVQKILCDESGLNYVCQTPERFIAVNCRQICQVLNVMIDNMKEQPSPRLLKHIIRCYLRLSEHTKVKDLLKKFLPPVLKDLTSPLIADDATRRWLTNLLYNLGLPPMA
jgi:CCR4-NOT transcription complex subunit 9